MTQSDLIEELAARCYLLELESAEAIVNLFFKEIMAALSQGKIVTLRGFGTFTAKVKPDRVAFNPRTRQKIQVAEKKFVSFKASRLLLKTLNRGVEK